MSELTKSEVEAKEVVNKIVDYYLQKDVEGIRSLLSEDIDLVLDMMGGQHFKGIENVMGLVTKMLEATDTFEIKKNIMMVEEDKVIVLLTERGKRFDATLAQVGNYTGKRLHIYTVKNSKIIKAEYFTVGVDIQE